MENKEWLNNLKENDEVGINVGYGRKEIGKVKRLTNTMIVLFNECQKDKDGRRYWKKNGSMVGQDGFVYETLTEPKKEFKDKIRKEELVNNLNKKNWGYFSIEFLDKIQELISEYKEIDKLVNGE